MDKIITSAISTGTTTPPTSDKVVTGQLVEVPEQLADFKIGDSMLLKVMFNNDAFKMNTDLSIKLMIDNEETPLQLKFDTPLRLEAEEPHQILARIISRPNKDNLQFQIISIDNKKAEQFILPPTANKAQNAVAQTLSKNVSATTESIKAESAPLIKELNSSGQHIKFIPLKILPTVENIMKEFSLPKAIEQQALQTVKNTELAVEFKAVLPSAQPSSLEPENNLIESLRQIFRSISVMQNDEQQVTTLLNRLSDTITHMPQQVLPAVVQKPEGSPITVFKTPLGNVLSDTPLKIQPQTTVLLALKPQIPVSDTTNLAQVTNAAPATETVTLGDVIGRFIEALHPQNFMPKLEKINPLQFLNSDKSGLEIMPETNGSVLPTAVPQKNSLQPLLDILKPLAATPKEQKTATQLLEKIPAPDNKILTNMTSFVKAATQGDVELWLGKALTEELKAMGPEGQEVLSRATQYVTAQAREGISWRSVEIPFLLGAEVSKIRLSIKKPQDEEEQDTPISRRKSGTRFLLETDFTKLGKFQFDGFSVVNERRFDLVVRTSRQFSEDFCSKIIKLFKTSLHEVNYVGNIHINLKENFIKISEDETEQTQIRNGVYI